MKYFTLSLAGLLFLNSCSSSQGNNFSTACTKTGVTPLKHTTDTSNLQAGKHILEYFIEIQINGTNVFVVADTGSSNLILKQSAYTPTGAVIEPYTISYGSGADKIFINEYQGSVALACGPSVNNFYYGSITGVEPSNYQTESILGLAYKGAESSSSTSQHAFIAQLTKDNQMSDEFAMLLCGFGNPNSQITFGGLDSSLHPQFTYVPITKKTWYVIQANSTTIGNSSPDELSGDTIVDSGTTQVILPQSIVNKIISAIAAKATGQLPTNVIDNFYTQPQGQLTQIDCSTVTMSQLPTISISLGNNFNLQIPPQNYLKNMGGTNCFFGFAAQAGTEPNILGQVAMENYYVHFDRKNNQIGFAPNTGLCGN